MKKKNILYLTDNSIYYKTNKIIKYPINQGIVINSKIGNIKKFNKILEELLKSNKLNNSILGNKIKVIINNTWTKADIELLKNILINLNYRKIDFEYDYKYYHLNNKNAYLNILDNYMLLTIINEYHKIKTILINNDLFDSIDEKMDYIAKAINNKELFILGYGEDLITIFNKFEEKYNITTYMFSNNESYILDSA